MEPDRLEWQKRCAFNAFCKRVLENEAANAHRDIKQTQVKLVSFSDLTPQEAAQLYSQDSYFEDESGDTFLAGGKKITTKLLAEALHTLPEEKRKAVLLYYFAGKSDVEIGEMIHVPRSTVQYRRTSSFDLLKRYLEEHADEWNDW